MAKRYSNWERIRVSTVRELQFSTFINFPLCAVMPLLMHAAVNKDLWQKLRFL